MATVDMDIKAAEDWKSSIDDLNRQLGADLEAVGTAVDTICGSSQGGVLDNLTKNYTQICEATGNLVNAFTGLVQSVGEVIGKATGLAGKIVDIIGLIGL